MVEGPGECCLDRLEFGAKLESGSWSPELELESGVGVQEVEPVVGVRS